MTKSRGYLLGLFLCCGLFLTGCAKSVSIDEAFSSLHGQMKNIRSLEIKTVLTSYSMRNPDKSFMDQELKAFKKHSKIAEACPTQWNGRWEVVQHDRYFRTQGERYAVTDEQTRSEGYGKRITPKSEHYLGYAFNGKQFQQRHGTRMIVSKSNHIGEDGKHPRFLQAFDFIRMPETPRLLSLEYLGKEDTWEKLKKYAVVKGRRKIGQYRCIIVELTYPELRSDGKEVIDRVYLGEDVGFFPVRIEGMVGKERQPGSYFEAENITKFHGGDGQNFYMFGQAVYSMNLLIGKNVKGWYHKTIYKIDLESLAFNKEIPDSKFQISVNGVTEYVDRDNPEYDIYLKAN